MDRQDHREQKKPRGTRIKVKALAAFVLAVVAAGIAIAFKQYHLGMTLGCFLSALAVLLYLTEKSVEFVSRLDEEDTRNSHPEE